MSNFGQAPAPYGGGLGGSGFDGWDNPSLDMRGGFDPYHNMTYPGQQFNGSFPGGMSGGGMPGSGFPGGSFPGGMPSGGGFGGGYGNQLAGQPGGFPGGFPGGQPGGFPGGMPNGGFGAQPYSSSPKLSYPSQHGWDDHNKPVCECHCYCGDSHNNHPKEAPRPPKIGTNNIGGA